MSIYLKRQNIYIFLTQNNVKTKLTMLESLFTMLHSTICRHQRTAQLANDCHLAVSPPSLGRAVVYGRTFMQDDTPAALYSNR